MQELKRLEAQWNDAARFRGVHASLHLDAEGLKLGAGTVVAKRRHDGSLGVDGDEERVLTLLSVAYGQALGPSALKSVRRASDHARHGDTCRAAMDVALAKLPRMLEPADAARRLFIADGLMAAGVPPRDIWKALEFDVTYLDALEKYDPDQPRVPAGSGRPSGEWTSGGGGGAEAAIGAAASSVAATAGEAAQTARRQLPKVLARLPGVLVRIAELARYADLPVAVAQDVLDPTDTGGSVISGKVRGLSNAYYQRHQDETALQVIDTSIGRAIATFYPTRVRGQYVDHESGMVAQMHGDELVIRSAIGAISEAQTRKDEPQQCPDPPVPDWKGMVGARGDRAREYVAIMKPQINPEEPTPLGMGYGLVNPVTGEPVIFDDCQKSTGILIDYKGIAYAEMLQNPGVRAGLIPKMLRQATNQVNASGGRTIKWIFAELPAMEYVRQLFAGNPLLKNIEFEYRPWPEGEKWRWNRTEWLRLARFLELMKRRLSRSAPKL